MIKYASNAFLATRVSFINEIARICDRLGANIKEVALGMGYDTRIGSAFLDAGLGFGGSCFPKDVKALMWMASDAGLHPQLLEAVRDINDDMRHWVVDELRERLGSLSGRRIALLGLAFKPHTDDVREAPSVHLIRLLQGDGATVAAYDPVAVANAAAVTTGVEFCDDPYLAASGSDAIVVVTEWSEFAQIDLVRLRGVMRRALLLDGRNLYVPEQLRLLGFEYIGLARGLSPTPQITGQLVTAAG
jgi:UDPglucose 6-dehydrogenase